MNTYTVTYAPSNGQPSNDYGGPYTSKAAAIAAARECARQCLLANSGGWIQVYPDSEDPPVWWWNEHIEGGYGGRLLPNGEVASVRL